MRPTIAVNDDELRRDAVRAALKGEKFRERYGRNGAFGNWMAAAGYESAEKLIDDVSEKLKKRLCRTEPAAGGPTVSEVRAELRAALDALGATEDAPVECPVPTEKINGNSRAGFLNDLMKLNENRKGFLSERLPDFEKAACQMTTWRSGKKNKFLNPGVSKPYTGSLCDQGDGEWAKLVSALTAVIKAFGEELLLGLTEFAAAEYERMKAESSVMTFDDMVLDASRVVREERAKEEKGVRSALLDAVRRKFRVALVDEFQDTDDRQWEIFRSIFSHECNKGDKPGFLLVVGDPKQAIYSFRGADLKVYEKAREEIEHGEPERNRKNLGETWRSTKELVDAFNAMFPAPDWFGEGYEKVRVPAEKLKSEGEDFTNRGAVTLLESLPEGTPLGRNGGLGNDERCLPVFLENAAREIKRLMSLDAVWTEKDGKTGELLSRPAQFGDFCVLVRGRKGAETAKRILGKHEIPYGYYKEAGIYDSAEAEAVLALFDFLAEPWRDGNLAALLLTPFFGVPPRNLAGAVERKPKAMVKLVEEWQLLVAKQKWNELFENVLSKSALSRPRKDDFEYDRRWAAIRQIFDKLLAELGRTATDIEEFAELLRAWRRDDSKAGDGGALRRKESDAHRVQIMTMHASKGLEFPVVFVAYGFSSIDQNRRRMTEEEKEENRNETRRLLYVALTRAKRHLYLPWSKQALSGKSCGVGSNGSALRGGFLSCAINICFGSAENAVAATLGRENIAESKLTRTAEEKGPVRDPEQVSLPADLAQRRKRWDSYSTLRKVSSKPRREVEGSADDKDDDEVNPLPGGKNAGLAFHKIMELLCGNDGSDGRPDFGTVGNAKSVDELLVERGNGPLWNLVRTAMKENSLKPDEKNPVAEKRLIVLAWQALNKELAFRKVSFRLKDVTRENRRAEVAFAVGESNLLGAAGPGRDGAFNGSVDLLVRPIGPGGPVYFLDWKTNTLADYDETSMGKEMSECGYDLQCWLYSLALRHWLGEGNPSGYAYVFVRGIEAEGKGVHLRNLEPPGWETEFLADLAKKIPGGRKDSGRRGGE